MPRRLAAVEPREVERVAREVAGVAFAELARDGDQSVLRVVLWQDAPVDETVGLVDVALRDSLDLELSAGDVHVAGYANPRTPTVSSAGDVRVIDLGANTWATESHDPGLMHQIPSSPGLRACPSLVSLSVTRTLDRCSAHVEVDAGAGVQTAESSGPSTDARLRRAVCEAAAAASAASLGAAVPDVERSFVGEDGGERVAVVVVAAGGDAAGRAAGAALLSDDVWRSFALASIAAVAALLSR